MNALDKDTLLSLLASLDGARVGTIDDDGNITEINPRTMHSASHKKSSESARDPEIEARVLKDMLGVVTRENPFKVGDIVRVVPGYTIYRYPDKGNASGLAIVTNIFPPQAERPTSSADMSAWHDNDMAILVRAGSPSRWVKVVVDSWRFEKYDGKIFED